MPALEKSKAAHLISTFRGLASSKSRKQLATERSKWDNLEFPTSADKYQIIAECGRGLTATVYMGICTTNQEKVAIKRLDLDNFPIGSKWEDVVGEAHFMASYHHPNLLPLLASFTSDDQLWMIEPYISHGSVLNMMKYKYPSGLPEEDIRVIMYETLKGLDYLHKHNVIHRDVKAGNILIDEDGHVYLADFGVSARAEKRGSQTDWAPRNTFVGTPCWMAPEVVERSTYDQSADIWSFGITLLELAHGHAPFAKYPPFKVILMTINNPPPSLDSDASSQKIFSRELHDLVAACLKKDKNERPTTGDLLEHRFFKHLPRDRDHLRRRMLAGLPDVITRVQQMRAGGAPSGTNFEVELEMQAKSDEEYRKGVSSWNFDVQALKVQAEMEEMPTIVDEDEPDTRSYHDGTQTSTHGLSRASSRDAPYLDAVGPRDSSVTMTTTSQRLPSPQPQTPSEGWPSLGNAVIVDGELDVVRQPPAMLHTMSSAWEGGAPSGLLQRTPSKLWEPELSEHKDTQVSIGRVIANTAAHELNGNAAAPGDAHAVYEAAPDRANAPAAIPAVAPVTSTASAPPAVPTAANIERHTRALEANGGPPPSVQHIGRFVKKTRSDVIHSDNGSFRERELDKHRATDDNLGITRSYTTASIGHDDAHVDDFLPVQVSGDATSAPGTVGDATGGPATTTPVVPAVSAAPAAAPTPAAAGLPTVAAPATVVGLGAAAGTAEASAQSTPPPRSKVAKGRFHITKSVNGDRETATTMLDMETFDSQVVRCIASSHDLSLASSPQPLQTAEDVPAAQATVAMASIAADTLARQTAPGSVTTGTGTTSAAAPSLGTGTAAGVAPTSGGVTPSLGPLAAAPGSTMAAAARKQSRFMVLEERGDWPARHAAEGTQATGAAGPALPAVTSASGGVPPAASGERRTAPGSAAAPGGGAAETMPIINRKLNELISASTAQQEAMRTLVSAISEASRGKDGLLLDLSKNPLIGIHLLGSEQSSNALVEQNTRLKHEVEEFKRKNKQHQEKIKALQREKELLKTQLRSIHPGGGASSSEKAGSTAQFMDITAASSAAPTQTMTSNAWYTGSVGPSALAAIAPGAGGTARSTPMPDTQSLPSASAPELPTPQETLHPEPPAQPPTAPAAAAPRASSTVHNPPTVPLPPQASAQRGAAAAPAVRPERLNLDLVGQPPSTAATPVAVAALPDTATAATPPVATSGPPPDSIRSPSRGPPHIWMSTEQREHARNPLRHSHTAPLPSFASPVTAPAAASVVTSWVQPHTAPVRVLSPSAEARGTAQAPEALRELPEKISARQADSGQVGSCVGAMAGDVRTC